MRPNLRKLAKNQKFEELEAACLERIGDGTVDREEMMAGLTLTIHRAETKVAEGMILKVLAAWTEKRGAMETLDLARDLAPLIPTNETLRMDVAGLYEVAYEGATGIETFLYSVAIRDDLDVPEIITRMDALLRLPPGVYVLEKPKPGISAITRRPPGRVEGMDDEAENLIVTIDGEPKPVTMTRAA